MVFSSAVFLILFLPVVILIYYNPWFKNRIFKNAWLFLSSILFYAYGEPVYVLLLILSIIINWILAGIIEKSMQWKKIVLVIGVLINISSLFIFKYAGFFAQIAQDLTTKSIPIKKILLPIGISFYTFQAISYLVDVYMQKAKAQSNIINVGLYIAFFPQLIAGPIVRYNSIAKQIKERKENHKDFYFGIRRFVIGMGKKELVANQVAVLADRAFSLPPQDLSVAMAWLGAIAYTLQIFFDFSGYSDMAIGLGKMFGFRFAENFDFPYISSSVTEFWRRWHISLGSWFRDYVYIPLGGNRKGIKRQALNLLIVWFLTGLWHGANWTFIYWGLFYFILLYMEKIYGYKNNWWGHIYTMLCVMFGWVIFRSIDMASAFQYIMSMVSIWKGNLIDAMFTEYFKSYHVVLIISILLCFPIGNTLKNKGLLCINEKKWRYLEDIGLLLIGIVAFCYIIRESYSPFIYFNF